MFLFISIIIIITLALLFAIINFQYTTTIFLLFYTVHNIPGILLLYIGILIGVIVTVPFIFSYSRKYANNILNKSIKQETKRLKQEEKNLKKINKKAKNTTSTSNKVN